MSLFLPVKATDPVKKLARLCLKEIMQLQSVPILIVSDRDTGFTFMFWKELQVKFGTRLEFSTTLYSQIDRLRE